MDMGVEEARRCFDERRWGEALERLTGLTLDGLEVEDHERRAIAAFLVGADDISVEAWETAYGMADAAGDPLGAARFAFWAGISLIMRGQMARAGGWLARVERCASDAAPDSGAFGYLAVPGLLGALESGNPQAAIELARQAAEQGRVVGDRDLEALGRLGEGQSLLAMGDFEAGASRFDDVMVSVAAGDIGPVASGLIYCAVIAGCMEVFDVSRAAEWTNALSDWCDTQPELVPYRGQCLVHRSQIQHMSGDWTVALESIRSACERLAEPVHPALGLANYHHGELLRATGSLDDAEAAYREASRHGFEPMPGLALLQLERGDADIAAASIDRLLQESAGHPRRPLYLAGAVEIHLAVDQTDAARAAADELTDAAAGSPSELVATMAAWARGAVTLTVDAAAALRELRVAAQGWRSLRMPYEAAATALLISTACAELGDGATAQLERDNAMALLADLGAPQHSDALLGSAGNDQRHGVLTARELEVLALVAAGSTNRQVAEQLTISQHTVRRHLENVYSKLGVGSRAAATAYAVKHDLF